MAGYATASTTEVGTVIIYMFDGEGNHVDTFEADGIFLPFGGHLRFLGDKTPPRAEIFAHMLEEIERIGGRGIHRRKEDEDHKQI